MMTMVKRNILVFTRDRVAFVMSFISVLILLVLYQVFLGKLQLDALQAKSGTQTVTAAMENMVHFGLVAGVVTIVSLTSTLGTLGVMVLDRVGKVDDDFRVTPTPRWRVDASYVFASVILGVITTVACLFLAIVLLTGFASLKEFSAGHYLQLFGLIILSCLFSATLMLPFLIFIKTSSAYDAVATIAGTAVGFLSGIYIPIGSLGKVLGQVVTWFPLTGINSLFKTILMKHSIDEAFKGAPAQARDGYEEYLGIVLKTWNGHTLSATEMVLYVSGCSVCLFVIYVVVTKMVSARKVK